MRKKEWMIHLVLIALILITGWGLGCRRQPMEWYGVFAVLFLLLLYRIIDYYSICFRIEKIWRYSFDLALAPTIYRMLLLFFEPVLQSRRTTFRLGYFDFFDYCIGIGLGGLTIWLYRYLTKYYSYRNEVAKGMSWKEKIRWEWKQMSICLKNIFLPLHKWDYDEKMSQVKGKTSGQAVLITLAFCLYIGYMAVPYLPSANEVRDEQSPRQQTREIVQEETAPKDVQQDKNDTGGDSAKEIPEKKPEKLSADQLAENETQRYPLMSQIPREGRVEDYICLIGEEVTSHMIEPGDGTLLIPGRNLLIPGQFSYVESQYSLGRRWVPQGGVVEYGAFAYDVPTSWHFDYPSLDICLTRFYSTIQPETDVSVHTTENTLFPEGMDDEGWEAMKSQIIDVSRTETGLTFSTPEFYRYTLTDGTDILFYTFVGEDGAKRIQYAVAYAVGDVYLTEFIGRSPLPETEQESRFVIEELVRYMAASYVEYGGKRNSTFLKDHPYLGEEDWPWDKLHNPFAMAEKQYATPQEIPLTVEDKEVEFISPAWEQLLYNMVGEHYKLSQKEREELKKRPLRLSDLSWITKVKLVEEGAGENVIEIGFDQWFYAPDTIDLIELNLTTLEDIAVLPNLQILNLEIGGVSDYDALRNAKKLTELRIYSQEFPEDTEWLRELPDLKVLSLGASYIGALNALGFEKEEGSTFGKKDFQKGYAGTGELEENLSQCTGLLYLQLDYSGPLTYGFLDKLPNLYTFIRYAEDELVDKNDGKAWAKEWNESKCPQIKCLVLGEQWLRNPE